ncbi:hypothetical protein ANANG_G00246660 [Anguilla anguilla]|uniref:Uncharacterized protein n=1 Tax=Anguilla anguilla TaxID=7936 RepID=A0A9D3LZQ5_ANGAN|nr:hypothetical protein ANANG_G00246660 [Anguilla anguilla]
MYSATGTRKAAFIPAANVNSALGRRRRRLGEVPARRSIAPVSVPCCRRARRPAAGGPGGGAARARTGRSPLYRSLIDQRRPRERGAAWGRLQRVDQDLGLCQAGSLR